MLCYVADRWNDTASCAIGGSTWALVAKKNVVKLSAMGQPTRLTQPSVPQESVNE